MYSKLVMRYAMYRLYRLAIKFGVSDSIFKIVRDSREKWTEKCTALTVQK